MINSELSTPQTASSRNIASTRARYDWLWDLLLIGVLLIGAYFRFTGLDWDQNQHLHPDERFLTMVETSIEPVESLGQYFDTQSASLNPNNRGYGFYVYGDLPLIVVRYVGEWIGKTGYDEINVVGRQVSAVMDLGTVLVVYLLAARLYRNRKLSLLAALFAALSVLPIQLSHYFTVDTFTNFFGMLAFYFAALILPPVMESSSQTAVTVPVKYALILTEDDLEAASEPPAAPTGAPRWLTQEWGSILPYLLFGAALGMAMASKINAVLLAALLPGAVIIRFLAQPRDERGSWVGIYLRNLVLAAAVSLIFFRIFQPYAFSGPGFFNMLPNEKWLASIKELATQSTGDVDFPPALQWARRPIWFALQNMLLWGLGLPLGLLACVGFAWMALRIYRSITGRDAEWRSHMLLWAWTGLYFAYQSINFTRTMRYQMLVYPTLAIIAAWAVFALWQKASTTRRAGWLHAGALLIGLSVLVLTAAWAFAFTRIYTRPVTRVEASRWIYQNVPGPLNLRIQGGEEITNQPLAFRSGFTLTNTDPPLVLAFRPRQAGMLAEINFEHLGSPSGEETFKTLSVVVAESPDGSNALAAAQIADEFRTDNDPRGQSFKTSYEPMVSLDPNKTYYLVLSLLADSRSLNLAGSISLTLVNDQGSVRQALPEPVEALRTGRWYQVAFSPAHAGMLNEVVVNRVVDWEARPESKTLRLSILDSANQENVLASAQVSSAFAAQNDQRGESYTFRFTQPLTLDIERNYTLRLEQVDGPGALALYGSKQANESSWDDALPVGLDGYNPYDYYQGVYRSDLNFEMYWDDNADKLARFESILDQADYIFISSNRQWGTTVRVPERYPLTSEYYRQLMGCPAEKEITWCYSVASPGMFQGNLGYDLVSVFQSDPNLGSLRFNTQFAEEAFTVYDHPKVLIFKKNAAYNPDHVQALLGAVDLSTVVHLTPRKAGSFPGNLLLPADRLAVQSAGGTWADLFPPDGLLNQNPALAAVVWYLVISVLGWVVYPFTRLALRGLPDRGYPFSRLVGMLLLAYPVWLLGSGGVPFSARSVTLVFAGLLLVNLGVAYWQRKVLLAELKAQWKYILVVELLILVFFLLFLLVRAANPDLWHPSKGGEKPMDFSYFNAVVKSTTFPPYDPWFAGGYINYYYYGFVIIGVPVKWLGIFPSIAYNLILPTLFALLAAGAFSVGWNLLSATKRRLARPQEPAFEQGVFDSKGPFFGGLFAALSMVILGNWGTMRMLWHGIQKVTDLKGVEFETASLITHFGWTFTGLWQLLSVPGTRLPYGASDWYWIPSRALPGWTITEFPAFTFLYGDPHAHMIALPITVLAVGWALSVLLGRWGWKDWWHLAGTFFLGALTIGTLKPTNTWDWPTYLALGCIAVIYTALRYGRACCLNIPGVSPRVKSLLIAVAGVGVLAVGSALLFQPYSHWYGSGYDKIIPWDGERSPFWSYMTHWGVFLFVLISWMTWESIDWLRSTPVSLRDRLRPHIMWIGLAAVLLVGAVMALLLKGVTISILALPLMLWAAVLLLRPSLPDAKRAVLFLVGTALFLTVFVEVARLEGDLDRMNTVFKFYLQAWTLLALSAGVSLVWLLPAVANNWRPAWRNAWTPVMTVLLSGALLFPLLAGMDKMTDRMAPDAPQTLDGMTYMAYSTYAEKEQQMDLSEDYRAIQWMQRSVKGSPVIVEANTPEYQWGSRFTIYTGLPGVVGWNWHQRQQRAITPDTWVFSRVEGVEAFYNTDNRAQVEAFLRRYRVKYIIVGQLERILYTPAGLQKFADWKGSLWHDVYHDGQTAIYEVDPNLLAQ